MRVISKQLKYKARMLLNGKYGPLAMLTFTMAMFHFAMEEILNYAFPAGSSTLLCQACSLLFNIAYYILLAGVYRIYLHICRGQDFKRGELYFGFSNTPEHIAPFAILEFILSTASYELMLSILRNVWAGNPLHAYQTDLLLFLVITIFSIWMQLCLFQVLFLYADAPWTTSKELFLTSIKMMKGQKRYLFYLELSFLGMKVLGLLSFGIGMLFIQPYMYVTKGLFYLKLCGQSSSGSAESESAV